MARQGLVGSARNYRVGGLLRLSGGPLVLGSGPSVRRVAESSSIRQPGQRAPMTRGREKHRPVRLISRIPAQALAASGMVEAPGADFIAPS